MKRQRPGWTREPGINGGTYGARWYHGSGAVVIHCGHPTANFPYYAVDAKGNVMVHPYGSKTFRHLLDAQLLVEGNPMT